MVSRQSYLFFMKIIGVSRYNNQLEIQLKPETALLVNNKPLFVPKFTDDVRARICILARISRLGRNIEQRFAARYYDATAIGLDFMAFDRLQEARTGGLSVAPWTAFDNSLALSRWTDKTEQQLQDLRLSINDLNATETISETPINGFEPSIAEAIELVSRYFKLCTGDIVAIGAYHEPIPMTINTQISVSQSNGQQNDEPLIIMNIK